MFLRTLMVVAVAALGIDSPSGFRLSDMAEHGRAWYAAGVERLEAWSHLGLEPTISAPVAATSTTPEMPNGMTAFAAPRNIEEAAPDQVFASVVQDMAASFAGDSPTLPDELVATASRLIAEDVSLYPGLAYTLNFEAEGLSLANPDRITISPEPESTLAAEAMDGLDHPSDVSRTERVEVAVKLTGQAIQAWLSLIQVTPIAD